MFAVIKEIDTIKNLAIANTECIAVYTVIERYNFDAHGVTASNLGQVLT